MDPLNQEEESTVPYNVANRPAAPVKKKATKVTIHLPPQKKKAAKTRLPPDDSGSGQDETEERLDLQKCIRKDVNSVVGPVMEEMRIYQQRFS